MERDQAYKIAVLTERLGRLMVSDAHAEGLLPVHWETLRYLTAANKFSRTLLGLTAYLGITKGTASQTLKALESKGLIRKSVDPRDRRSNRLVLTAKGTAALKSDPLSYSQRSIEQLKQSTRNELEQGLTEFLHQRLADNERKPFGQCNQCVYFSKNHPQQRSHYCELLNEPLTEADSHQICVEQLNAI